MSDFERGPAVDMDDLILVSVDDHVVEPPDVFEHHLPAKYKDIAPRVEHRLAALRSEPGGDGHPLSIRSAK